MGIYSVAYPMFDWFLRSINLSSLELCHLLQCCAIDSECASTVLYWCIDTFYFHSFEDSNHTKVQTRGKSRAILNQHPLFLT